MNILLALRAALSGLVAFFIGEFQWRAPAWLRGLRRLAQKFVALVQREPRAALVVSGLVVVLVAGGYAGWQWWTNRPQPVEIEFSVSAPARTCYECESEEARKPNPLLIRFSDSVARLEAAGKTVDPAQAGITLSPEFAGEWRWDDDKLLRFTPQEDWPIGETFEVAFAKKSFTADHVRLRTYSAEFLAPAFEAVIESNDFYQDPVKAGDKKIVTTLRFSHPVDAAELESRLHLTLYNKISDGREEKLDAPRFSVTYDKLKLHAYAHSEALSVPAKEGRAEFSVDEGLRAARGGNKTGAPLSASVIVPGLYSLSIPDLRLQVVRDEREEPSQVLMLETAYSTLEKDLTPKVHAWLLPLKHPDEKTQKDWQRSNPGEPYNWSGGVRPEILQHAQALALNYVANEREHVELHSFRYDADPRRFIYVRVDKGVKSFGGYLLAETQDRVLQVPEYPQELRIAQQGSLLALSGSKKLTVFTRDLPGLRVEIGRLLPNQLHHLITQTGGELSAPQFNNWQFDETNLTERHSVVIKLPKLKPGTAHYETLDFADYLNHPGASRRGMFFLRVEAYDPATKRRLSVLNEACEDCGDQVQAQDARLVVVTDLGLLTKRTLDGGQDVFVQSIHDGAPVAGVTLDILGKNGEPVLSQTTDEQGHARFADLKSFKREKQPVLILARRGGDESFLPLNGRAHSLDLSRFEVGGVSNVTDAARLTAYLFSDRGIYRPGDEIRAAAIVKSQNWKALPAGLPLRVQITDPRGVVIRRENLKLSAGGLEEIKYQTRETAPTGSYNISLSIIKDEHRHDLIGSLDVKVQEFLPDRLKMSAHFSAESTQGWVTPDDLSARVQLQNLFGTPAAARRVTGTLRLSPWFPRFAPYADYEFRDPQAAKEGFSEELAETQTGESGEAQFDLNLKRYARATYRLNLVTQGFEADGGRGVSAEAAQLVSSLPYLVGWKADGDLGYVSKGAERKLTFIAINPRAQKTAVKALKLLRIERKVVSVLLKQDNGTYKYESRQKEVTLSEAPFEIAAEGTLLALDAATPGNFSIQITDGDGQLYARVDYSVAGEANLTRSLEKNAELQIVLNRKDYAPGEEIEMHINAPYTGAGLITIERDKVYRWQWFRTSTTSSVQRIRVPDHLEGNAYINVSFVRDPASAEIYSSPLSYGVQPFSIARDARRSTLTVSAPALVKPGETIHVRYKTDVPSRLILFAVDEGILQVARYPTPDPLEHFFAKRALEVQTQQILDLILPEFRAAMSAAPGGDADGALGRHLNPFKRKTDKPVAWWSGVVEAGRTERSMSFTAPDYFNGTLRLLAVAVSDQRVGVYEGKITVRGDFVLSPNAPLTVTPGDEFEVSVGVANNLAGSGAEAMVAVALAASTHLQILGEKQQTLKIAELREGSTRFRLKALDELGSATLHFSAAIGSKSARLDATLSVRPATPYMVTLSADRFKRSASVNVSRELYPQYRELEASVSALPLSLAHGLASYLANYPYACTEQLVSMAMPGIVLSSRPEFGRVKASGGASVQSLVDELRLRQNSDGGYRYWPGGVAVEEYVSLYAQHVLLEAGEHGLAVPRDLLESGNAYLRTVAARDGNNLNDERNAAYAVYLLARQGILAANEASALQARLEARYDKEWRTDITAAYLGAAYQLMQQQALADKAMSKVQLGRETRYDRWHGPMVSDAVLLYLTARHFPQRLKKLPEEFLDALVGHVKNGDYHSLAAATAILGLDAYASVAGEAAAGKLGIREILRDKSERALALPSGLFPKADFSAQAAQLVFSNEASLPAYYLVNQSGFDRKPPTATITQNFEILREYTDASGAQVTRVKMGDEVTVHVKYRAIGRTSIDDAVLVDLLPGGFEPVIPRSEPAAQAYVSASPDQELDAEGEALASCSCGILWSYPPGGMNYSDTREDRVVAYGRVSDQVQEFTYRIKATNVGRYTVPPAYGESMYEPQVKARSVAGTIEVTRP